MQKVKLGIWVIKQPLVKFRYCGQFSNAVKNKTKANLKGLVIDIHFINNGYFL